MPKVVIELQANTQAAVAQIQAFAKAQRDAFDAVRAGNPALEATQIRVSKLTETTKGGTQGLLDFNREAKSLVHGGLSDLLQSVPIVGSSLAALADNLSGFPLLLGAVVGAGIGVLKWLQSLDEDSTKALQSVTALSEGMATTFRQTQLEVARIRAESQGDSVRATTLSAEKEMQAAEDVKNTKIAKAKEELDALTWYGTKRTTLSTEALAAINTAEFEAANKKILINEKLTADLKKLEDERKKASLEWLDKEIARLQEADAAARAFAQAKTAASFEAQLGAAERGGDPVMAARVRYAQQTEALKQSLEDQIQAQAAKLNKGEILDTEFEARKRNALEVTAQRQATLTEQFVANEQAAYATLTTSLQTLLGRLGPGFEDLQESLDISGAVDASRQSFQTIQAAFDAGRLSASQAAEAVRIVTEQLLAQGAKMDEIATVVPQQLQTMSSLFRGMSSEIRLVVSETGNVQTAMNQLSPGPILTLTGQWYSATAAAETYRQKVMEITRIGPVTPREGMLTPGTQATTVVLPQEGGMSAEDRRTLAEQLADDERRGLLE